MPCLWSLTTNNNSWLSDNADSAAVRKQVVFSRWMIENLTAKMVVESCTVSQLWLEFHTDDAKFHGKCQWPHLTFGVGRLLHLPSAEAVSVRPNAQPRCNQKVTVIGCEAETSAVKPKSAVKPNKSPATWDWWRVVWLFLSGGLLLVSSSPSD